MSSQEGLHRVIRRVCSRLFFIALGLVTVLLLLIALFIWRLAEEPIPLNLLAPYIEAALPPSLSGLQIDVQDVALAWHRQAKRIVLSARDMHLRDAQGIVDATLPTVDVTLNLPALLRQRVVALNKVYIDGAQIHLQHNADDTRQPKPSSSRGLLIPTSPNVLKTLETYIAAIESDPLLADLRAVHVVNSAVTLQTSSLAHPLHIPTLAITLRRTAANISSDLRMTTSLSDPDITFALDTSYERATHHLTLKSEFGNLRPSALATLHPTLSELSGISIPFQGSFELALNRQDTWPAAKFDLEGGEGRMMLSSLYRKPRQIKQVTASGSLNGASATLRIETATLDLGSSQQGKPSLHLQGTIKGLSRPTHVEGHVTLKHFTMADLERYWPKGAADAPRQWITQNMPVGLINQAKAHLVLSASKANPNALVVQDINGSLQYDGLSVHYLRPLPPIRNITGKGQFNRSGFHFQIASGDLGTMALTGSDVDITGIDRGEDAIAIRAGIAGDLLEALNLLNHPRLDLIAGLGISPETVSGRFQVEHNIAFSLSQSVRLKDVDINVQGALQQVSLQNAALRQDLSHGQLRIDLDKRRMTLEGQAELANIPLSFTWHEIFNQQNPDDWRNQMHVVIPRVGHAGRAWLGYDLPDVIEGPIAAVIDTQSGWDDKQTIHLQLNLRDTALHVPWLNWHKPAGESANAVGKLQLAGNRAVALTDLLFEAETLKARGSAQFDGATLARFDLPHVIFGASDLRDVVFQRLKPGLAITVGDGFLDAAPFRQPIANRSTTLETNRTQPTETFPVQLHLPRLHRVQMAPGRYLQNVQAYLAWNGAGWQAITASGQIPAKLARPDNDTSSDAAKTFDFHYLPAANKQPNLSLKTNDIGALLHALNVSDNLIGGDFSLTGRTKDNEAGIKTKLQATQFTVKQAPVFAHVLAAASLHGFANLLSNHGLKFDNLDAEITLRGDQLRINRSHAHGGSLGVTARGDIAYQSGALDVQGTVIPAYLVNSILGQVPVVNLLVGGKGQGLVAVNYHLTGGIAEPQVSVNPISALTPGFLRGLFGLFKPDKDEDTQPSAPKSDPEQDTQITEP